MARQNFSLQHQSIIELIRNENKEKNQSWDYYLMLKLYCRE